MRLICEYINFERIVFTMTRLGIAFIKNRFGVIKLTFDKNFQKIKYNTNCK